MTAIGWVDKLRKEITKGSIAAADHAAVLCWLLHHRLSGHPDEPDKKCAANIRSAWNHLCSKETILLGNAQTQETAEDFAELIPVVLQAIRLVMRNCNCGALETRNF